MKQYTNKEIRDFIKCPQFGDIKYGKWGSLRLDVRQTLLNLININDSMDYIIKQQYQELQRKDNEINNLKGSIADYQEAVGDYQDELKREDNNWNELKKYLEYEIEEWKDVENEWGKIRTSEDENILDKIKELEERR